ncbi:conserved hypothetical protein [Phenylobacterium zucineum HLK1]|uniref:FO synthase n=1 Tax=Phenylobacterium zucineum (strain HLK1) TaxID=450851 RepID=B4RGN9_PHEZH|nr:5-amino-6-(D-ribitylamino)uracil--L-tyrosine 4-hydroxyphenyl transferase CofH [Phenylobacterium zucineum]ACG78945.1 conserved hypothetical protein [Phenylobacterium zucineum HLK1]
MKQADLRRRLMRSPIEALTAESGARRDAAFGRTLTYSRKVFVPLTQLCRDVCHYCTFAKAPRAAPSAYLDLDEVLEIARAGARAGCKEALFTLGDKPELRYPAARKALDRLGFASTVEYLAFAAGRVLEETGLLPHINAGVLSAEDYARLRPVSASMGLMLESASERLCRRGGPHFGSPDKHPAVRLASISAAGEAQVPFTSGLLIGIGETREERLDALFELQALHDRHGHLQEIIVQNFRAKPGTRMASAPESPAEELLWTLAAARLILPETVSVQAPPNLSPGAAAALIQAGLDDFGGISPVTIDHVNPEAPWPQIAALEATCAEAGRRLTERLTAYPRFVREAERWMEPGVRRAVLRLSDSVGLTRDGAWSPGVTGKAPGGPADPLGTGVPAPPLVRDRVLERCLQAVRGGRAPAEADLVGLFAARGAEAADIAAAADDLRRETCGDAVSYVVNRNINYTNICAYSCSFCAFSKASSKAGHRDRPYVLELPELARRAQEAWDRGATEVCLQGGIHPRFTGRTYLDVVRAVKEACPGMHVHAFSPLEIAHGAETLEIPVGDFLRMLKDEGLGSLPGTAAEILHDDVRRRICPDKLTTAQWLEVVETAHRIGLPTTSTIMFGHVETPEHWASHLLALRDLQARTGGITEFVPLPFVHMEAPVYLRGEARRGPTWRESVLMHAVGRIALHGQIRNVQASWVKLGLDGASALLAAGVNDLGGVLMNESISRAAGAAHGQELGVGDLEAAILAAGRCPIRRTTLYADAAVCAPAAA